MCTAVSFWSTEHHRYFGRTMDFPVKNTPWNLTYLPKGYLWRPLAPQAAYPSKYAILGGMRRVDDYYLIGDGFNQAGLAVAELYFPGQVDYAARAQPGKINLSPQDVIGYLLGNCANISEVAALLPLLVITNRQWYDHDIIHPFHWFIQDASGTYLLEPTSPTLSLQRVELGVLTNSPTYANHLRRLRSFLGLSADAPLKTVEEPLKDYQGDLPQARSPRSRFIATSIRLAHQLPVDDHQAVAQSMKVLGAVKMAHLPGHDDFTHYLGMADLNSLRYFFTPVPEMTTITQSLPALMAKYSTPQVLSQVP